MIQSLKKDIAKLSALADGWDEEVNALERELFLDLLRRMYEKVRWSESECQQTVTTPQMSVTQTIAALATMGVAQTMGEEDEQDEPECEVELVMEEGNVAIPVGEASESDENGDPDFEVELVINDDQDDDAEEVAVEDSKPEECGVEANEMPEPTAVAQSVTEPKPASEPAPSVEATHTRPKISRQVIDTLYGEGTLPKVTPTPQAVTPQAVQVTEQPAQTVVNKPSAQPTEPKQPTAQTVTPSVVSAAEPSVADVVTPKTVLGDVINTGAVRLGDSLQSDGLDVATKIAAGEVSSLRGAMGLNDKVMIMRDLFGGDAAMFDTVMDELDAQPTLDDALIYMSGYAWNSSSDGAKMLMTLLKLKFS